MPRDTYYSSLSQNKDPNQQPSNTPAGGGFAPGLSSVTTNMGGQQNAGQPGGSPYDAGSGFVNLSHLLALNGASGQASAQDAASKLAKQGKSAQGAIQSAQDNYNQQVNGATVNSANVINGLPGQSRPYAKNNEALNRVQGPGANQLGYLKDALDKANAGYKGPQSLEDTAGYGDLSKKVSDAQNRAQNDQSGYGQAAQISQDTGLSARQAAASAFYQGVTNPNLIATGKRYGGLGKMLSDADADSVNSSDMARKITSDSAQSLNDYYNNLKNQSNPGLIQQTSDAWEGDNYPWASHQRGNSSELRDIDPEDTSFDNSPQGQLIRKRKF